MTILILLVVFLVFIGPLRRPYFRNWRFTLPATAAWIAGFVFSAWFISVGQARPPLSILMPIILPFGMAIIVGESVKAWFDRVFPRNEAGPRNEGHRNDRR